MLIFSLGGSIINPGKIDINFLKNFKVFCNELVKQGEQIAIITGGGAIAREYQLLAKEFDSNDNNLMDKIGIWATKLNAQLVISALGDLVYPTVLETPQQEIIKTGKKIFVFSGWAPGWSTDYVSVVVANRFKINKIYNLTNIAKVYNKNKKDVDNITWNEYLNMVGNDWNPGMNTPFDPIGAKRAKELGIEVLVLKGTNLTNLEQAIKGKSFEGTVII